MKHFKIYHFTENSRHFNNEQYRILRLTAEVRLTRFRLIDMLRVKFQHLSLTLDENSTNSKVNNRKMITRSWGRYLSKNVAPAWYLEHVYRWQMVGRGWFKWQSSRILHAVGLSFLAYFMVSDRENRCRRSIRKVSFICESTYEGRMRLLPDRFCNRYFVLKTRAIKIFTIELKNVSYDCSSYFYYFWLCESYTK